MASRFWVGGTGTWDSSTTTHWSASSGGTGGQSVPGSSDTVTFDGSSGGGTVTPNYDMSVTSVTMGAFTGTLDFSANNNNPTVQTFSGSGTGTRTLNMGNGTWTVTGNAATVWTFLTPTNLTFNGGSSTINFTYAGSTGTRTVSIGGAALVYGNINFSAGSDIVSITSITASGNLSFSGFSGTVNKTTANFTIAGSLTLGTGMAWSTTSGTISMTTSGSATITTNGVQLNQTLQINATGTVALGSDLDVTGSLSPTLTLLQGTFSLNNFNLKTPLFNSSNSNTRTFNMGSGTMTVTASSTSAWNMNTSIGLTFNAGTSQLTFTGTAVTFTGASLTFNNVSFTGGGATVIANTRTYNNLTYTGVGAGDSLSLGSTQNVNGILTLSGAGGNPMTVMSTVGGTVRQLGFSAAAFSNVAQFTDINVDQLATATGTWTLTENLLINGAGLLTYNGGTFNGSTFNLTMPSFISGNSGTRNWSMGSGTWTLTGTGTVWSNLSTGGLASFSAGTSTIKITDTSSASKTFTGGQLVYNNLWFTGGTGVLIIGTSVITGNGFNNFRADPGSTVNIFAGKTITANSLTWSGTAGNLNTFQSTTNGQRWTISVASGLVSEDYIALKDSNATGGAEFVAGPNSVDNGNNAGWIFGSVPVAAANAAIDGNRVPTVMGMQNNQVGGLIRLYVNPTSHGMAISDGTGGNDYGTVNAERDGNRHTGIIGASSADGITPVPIYIDTANNGLLIKST